MERMVPTGRLDLRDHKDPKEIKETQEIQDLRDPRDPLDWTVRMVPTELSDQWGRKDHKDPPG
jgi:hypothetical protein